MPSTSKMDGLKSRRAFRPKADSLARQLAQMDGRHIPEEYIFGGDWASLEYWDSPRMRPLRYLIEDREIHAVYQYDADRGPSRPAHRLLYRAVCKDNGVKIRRCYDEVPEGEMSDILEALNAWKKE
jgi:hypothetical protein